MPNDGSIKTDLPDHFCRAFDGCAQVHDRYAVTQHADCGTGAGSKIVCIYVLPTASLHGRQPQVKKMGVGKTVRSSAEHEMPRIISDALLFELRRNRDVSDGGDQWYQVTTALRRTGDKYREHLASA